MSDNEQPFEFGSFTIQRGRGHAVITIALEPEPHWVWQFWPPEHERPEIEHFARQEDGFIVHDSRPWVPTDVMCDTAFLLTCLGVDEAKQLLGYCAHLVEHSTTHVQTLHEALGEALEAGRWSAIETLAHELAAAVKLRQFGQQASRAAFDATEVVGG